MIAAIGIMIGIYIITRMISFLTRKEPQKESASVKVFAVITIVITIFCMFSLLASSLTPTKISNMP